MQLLSLRDVLVGYPTKSLFLIDHLAISEGDKIGLIGVNGSGKTTLLKIISADLEPLEGEVERLAKVRVVPQIATNMVQDAGWRERGLWGVEHKVYEKEETYSGGERVRERLANAFALPADLYILDEPTANLDLQAIELLENQLENLTSFILVSHDRELLNRVTNRTIEIREGRIFDFPGNYAAYHEWLLKDLERRQHEYDHYVEEKKRLETVFQDQKRRAERSQRKPKNKTASEIRQIKYGAVGKSIQGKQKSLNNAARNTLRRIERMEVKEKPKQKYVIRPDFSLTDPPQNSIIAEAFDLNFTYPNGLEIFSHAEFHLDRNKKVVLRGDNGSGKSTLLRLMFEDFEEIRTVPKAKYGYFRQGMESLDLERTVLENVRRVSCQSEEVNRNILARMGFFHNHVDLPAKVLSGGERMKLEFAMLFVSDVNVLLLDEPTNYLDLASLTAIEEMLEDYEGLPWSFHTIVYLQKNCGWSLGN